MLKRLFTSGTHNGLTFSNEEIEAIFALSVEKPEENIPFVLGHPKNNLPILGWVKRGKLDLYQEGDKMSIGFERKDAEFAEESVDILKKRANDKISVKLEEGVITHIGFVKKAAVKENNAQTFSSENKTGVLCFSEDFDMTEDAPVAKEAIEDRIVKKITQLFNKTPNHMDPNEQKIKDLEAKIAQFEAKEAAGKEDDKIKNLEAKIATFEAKEKEGLKADLKAKVDALKLSDEDAKAKMSFGESLIEKDADLFRSWIGDLKPTVVVTKGSVTANFSKAEGAEKPSVQDEIAAEYAALKK